MVETETGRDCGFHPSLGHTKKLKNGPTTPSSDDEDKFQIFDNDIGLIPAKKTNVGIYRTLSEVSHINTLIKMESILLQDFCHSQIPNCGLHSTRQNESC